MSEETMTLRWVTEESREKTFTERALKAGGSLVGSERWEPGPDELDDYGDAFFEPLAIVTIVISIGWLIRTISEVIRDLTRSGGQLVDTRGDIRVRPLPNAEPGTLVVVSKSGSQVFTRDRHDEGLSLIKRLLGVMHA